LHHEGIRTHLLRVFTGATEPSAAPVFLDIVFTDSSPVECSWFFSRNHADPEVGVPIHSPRDPD